MCAKRVLLSLMLVAISGSHAVATLSFEEDAKISETNICIPHTDLTGSIRTLVDSDGGIYAFIVSLQNLSKTNDVILSAFDALEENINFSFLAEGVNIRTPLNRLKAYEVHLMEMPLKRASKIEWFVRMASQLGNQPSFSNQMSGFLGVNFFFRYRIAEETNMSTALRDGFMHFRLKPVLITHQALEGDASEKYERSQATALLKGKAEPTSVKTTTNAPVASLDVAAHNPPIKTREEVMSDLKEIQAAKYQWALEHNKKSGDLPSENDLANYFKANHAPEHPASGHYIINAIGVAPESSLYGKRLP